MDPNPASVEPAFFQSVPVPLDSKYKGFILIIFVAICFPLLLFFVLLRSYVRIWVPRSFALDDAACLLATIGTISYGAVLLSSINLAGRPLADLPLSVFTPEFFKELVFVYEMLYGPSVFFAKLSLFLLYLRIFSPDPWTRFFIHFGIICTFIYYTTTAITLTALCAARKGESWPQALLSARCHKALAITYVQGIFNIVSDFYLLILPIPVIWKLQQPLRKKIGVSAVFMTGLIACIASSIGLYYRILLSRDSDWTSHIIGLGSAVMIEMTLGIVCGCMPYVASTLKRWFLKSSQSSMLKNIKSRIFLRLSRRSDQSKKSPDFRRVDSPPNQGHYLETNILGSVRGAGKFIESRNFDQREWLDRTAISHPGHKEEAVPEGWGV